MQGRPLYCLPPLLLDWAGKPAPDRYLNYLGKACRDAAPAVHPAEAVIQNQLFSAAPL
jgi:hypothetical protein